jgi:hypothetical protein
VIARALTWAACAALVVACGDSRERPSSQPVEEPRASIADQEEPVDPPRKIGLSDEERERLKKEYVAEAQALITVDNAETVGRNLLVAVEKELAAELALAPDAGAD